MDPVSIIVMALVSGMTLTLNPSAEQTIKDAYTGIKTLIQHKFGQVDLSVLEAYPTSHGLRNETSCLRKTVRNDRIEGVEEERMTSPLIERVWNNM